MIRITQFSVFDGENQYKQGDLIEHYTEQQEQELIDAGVAERLTPSATAVTSDEGTKKGCGRKKKADEDEDDAPTTGISEDEL